MLVELEVDVVLQDLLDDEVDVLGFVNVEIEVHLPVYIEVAFESDVDVQVLVDVDAYGLVEV